MNLAPDDMVTKLESIAHSMLTSNALLAAVFLAAAIGFTCSCAHADGDRMFELCSRPHRDLIAMYVEGALDNAESDAAGVVLELENALEAGSPEIAGLKRSWKLVMPYCAPSRFKVDQATDIFCDFLTLNPQKRRHASILLLSEALQKAWPCRIAQTK